MRRERRLKGLFEIEYKNNEIADGLAKIYVGYSPYSDIMYIGQSEDTLIGIEQRHSRKLRKNEHHCKVFQQLYNYVGEENIIFKIVDKCLSSDRLSIEGSYHIMNDSKYVICSHGYRGTKFYWDFYDYKTEPYFTILKNNEKFLIKIYMDYYRKKNGDRYLHPQELLNEVLKSGISLLEDSQHDKEFRKIINEVLDESKIEEINIHDTTSKYIYIKIIYDIYKDDKEELKKILIDNIYKERALYKSLLRLSVSYSIEFETGEINTLKSMGFVIRGIFNSQQPFKPRYSDLVYYYWLEECSRYLFKQKYSW